ncbi:hydrogenase small subunit [uncultured Mailhella sp.]|uniref:hydrogenase small subunit n=1 Tax=uncultured Mailhella sp. TaxID=1981031 RepID=UPI0025D73A8E|nr:hydrogenase small subunit [uncultured Mailhella sp.]
MDKGRQGALRPLSRRSFLRSSLRAAALGGVTGVFDPGVARALAETLSAVRPPVFWLQGMGCTGCSVSLLNSLHPTIAEVLLHVIRMDFHPTLMAEEGEGAMSFMLRTAKESAGRYLLAVEGAVSEKDGGRYCVIGEAGHEEFPLSVILEKLAPGAAALLAVGGCAAYGGVSAARGCVTGACGVGDFLRKKGVKTPVINIPGCPPHPDWMVGTLLLLLAAVEEKGLAEGVAEMTRQLDSQGRPLAFYGNNTHENCPYLYLFDEGRMAKNLADKSGCRYGTGCKGPGAWCDSPLRRWNGRVNWCVENALCIGCVQPDFPDGQSPFYRKRT